MADSKPIAFAAAGAILVAGLLRLPVEDSMYFWSQQLIAVFAIYLAIAVFAFVKVNRWVGALFLSACVATMYPKHTAQSALAIGTWTAALCLYAMVLWYGDKKMIPNAICVVSIVHVAFQVMQHFGVDPIITLLPGHAPTGLMTRPNETAGLMALAAPAFWRAERPTAWGRTMPFRWSVLSPIPILGLVLCRSFSGALGVGVAVFVALALLDRKALAVTGLLAAVGLYAVVDLPESAGMRLQAWIVTIKQIAEHPLSGYGLGNWLSYDNPLINPGTCVDWSETVQGGKACNQFVLWETAHNDWLQWTYEQGLRFPLLLIGYLASLIIRPWNAARARDLAIIAAGCAACVVCASVHWLFQTGTTAVIATAYFALLDKETSLTAKTERNRGHVGADTLTSPFFFCPSLKPKGNLTCQRIRL